MKNNNDSNLTVNREVVRRPKSDIELSSGLQSVVKQWAANNQGAGVEDLLRGLNKTVIESMLEAELDHHLGYGKHSVDGDGSGNNRNGYTSKKVHTEVGPVEIEVPRDREGSFSPSAVKPYQRRLNGFDDMVISLYGKGLTTGEIRSHLEEIYDAQVSAELISTVTDRVIDEYVAWQNRPLENMWPVIAIDAIRIRTLSDKVRATPVYVAMGINITGYREILGFWYADDLKSGESSSWWANVLSELQNRGVQDVLYLCCDGLKGLPKAVNSVFPETIVQGCVVHLTRASVRGTSSRYWGKIYAQIKKIYTAASVEEASLELDKLDSYWGEKYPAMINTWRDAWDEFTPYLALPQPIRKLIYTTNMIESFNARLRSSVRRRGHFPDTKSALKILYLQAIEHRKNRSNPQGRIFGWEAILNQLAILHPDRIRIDQ